MLSRPPKYRLQLIGGLSLIGDRDAPIGLKSKKGAAIIGYLSVRKGMCETRERLAGLLWSEDSEEKARMSLRQCLRQIRLSLGSETEPCLEADRQLIRLTPNAFDVDVLRLQSLAERREFADPVFAQKYLTDSVLYGFDGLDPAFDTWLAVYREGLRASLQSRLELSLASESETPARLNAARALNNIDPSHEIAVREIMRGEAETGNQVAALRHYAQFKDVLRDEYDIGPDAETVTLARSILDDSVPAGSPNQTSNLPSRLENPTDRDLATVIVGEFGTSLLPESIAYKVIGIRQIVLNRLTRFRNWIVIDEGFKEQPPTRDAPAADYYLAADASYDHDELTLWVRLVEPKTRSIVWSDTITNDTERFGQLHEEIARRLSAATNIYISEDRMTRQKGLRPDVLSAYDKWMKGVYLLQQWTAEAEREAEQLFKEVITTSPDLGSAYANLADIYNSRHIVFPGRFRSRVLERKSLRLALQAVALEALDARCHLTLGWSQLLAGRPSQALHSFAYCHELNPSDPALLISCAHGAVIGGDGERAAQYSALAFEMHPSPPRLFWAYESDIRFLLGDYDACIEAANRAGDVFPNIHGWTAAALALRGDQEEAAERAGDFLASIRRDWVGDVEPTPRNIVRWFVQIFPFGDPQHDVLLREGLRLAGLPVATAKGTISGNS